MLCVFLDDRRSRERTGRVSEAIHWVDLNTGVASEIEIQSSECVTLCFRFRERMTPKEAVRHEWLLQCQTVLDQAQALLQ